MARELDEWIGKSDDTAIPLRVQLRIFERCGGVCHISGRKIRAGAAKGSVDGVDDLSWFRRKLP